MKKVLEFFTMITFIYLVGAFYNVSFNIVEWSDNCRLLISLTTVVATIGLATFPKDLNK